jgi:hypothetical protein
VAYNPDSVRRFASRRSFCRGVAQFGSAQRSGR